MPCRIVAQQKTQGATPLLTESAVSFYAVDVVVMLTEPELSFY